MKAPHGTCEHCNQHWDRYCLNLPRLKCWDTDPRIRPLSASFGFFPTCHQLSSTQKYIYTWPIQKNWMFWKAMSLNRPFLLSKSHGARLWYPLVPILREGFLGNFSLIFCSVLTQSFSIFFHIPLWGVPYVPTDHPKHRESTSYIPLELSWKS